MTISDTSPNNNNQTPSLPIESAVVASSSTDYNPLQHEENPDLHENQADPRNEMLNPADTSLIRPHNIMLSIQNEREFKIQVQFGQGI